MWNHCGDDKNERVILKRVKSDNNNKNNNKNVRWRLYEEEVDEYDEKLLRKKESDTGEEKEKKSWTFIIIQYFISTLSIRSAVKGYQNIDHPFGIGKWNNHSCVTMWWCIVILQACLSMGWVCLWDFN